MAWPRSPTVKSRGSTACPRTNGSLRPSHSKSGVGVNTVARCPVDDRSAGRKLGHAMRLIAEAFDEQCRRFPGTVCAGPFEILAVGYQANAQSRDLVSTHLAFLPEGDRHTGGSAQ